jgi:hypothetical protein
MLERKTSTDPHFERCLKTLLMIIQTTTNDEKLYRKLLMLKYCTVHELYRLMIP